ncbi:NUDIX hydrolase domain-like protein [Immersiella caudata]|uniref:NAD(+) diphosphatase n=1 Tax=Immersiella caudata TaxID=314043 RepID=A0AA39WWR2_9PEZI|nr:NUDIX hydrolase domain-like protein [Immersiella caudata]
MPIPSLPILSHSANDNSHLTAKFGPETSNYFSGSPLNRLSFLRTDHDFLQLAFSHPSAAFLLMNSLAPLVQASDSSQLGFVSGDQVFPLTGREPFVKTEEELVGEFDSSATRPVVIFLGVDEDGSFPSDGADRAEEGFKYKDYTGVPYFGVDVTPKGTLSDVAKGVIEKVKGLGLEFHENSPRHMGLHAGQAATYGYARALLDWNVRNPFCAQCGQPTLSVNAGTKRVCPPTDSASGGPVARLPCATRNTVSNLSFPRTDPTVIMAIVSSDGTRILLGRQRRWPPNWYSTLAGFQEPGESIEEAVRREVWEESGVKVGRVVLHSSQPWPFPASLMIGAIGQALPGDGETVYLGNDKELEDARWFSTDEVREALLKGVSNLGEAAPEGYVQGRLRLPPQTAIANRLITAVVDGWWRAKI